MSAHTPGPWRLDVETTQRFDAMTGEPRVHQTFWIKGPREEHIALVSASEPQSQHANAQLLTAAPELLEVLRSVAQRVHQAYHEGEPADCETGVCADIRAAIAEAEGREAETGGVGQTAEAVKEET